MAEAVATARQLLERTGEHPVISLYFDLDPAQFATAPARATQLSSLLDQARRRVRHDESLDHQARSTLNGDLERVEAFLGSDDAPVKGAKALAVFCSGGDELFEAVQMTEPAEPKAVIARRAHITPLVIGPVWGSWCVALVNRREALLFQGVPERVRQSERIEDHVHQQHSQGGWSQANYERSVQDEAESHLRRVAEDLLSRLKRDEFKTLVVGGPHEVVSSFRDLLSGELHAVLLDRELDLDMSAVKEADVRSAVGELATELEIQEQIRCLQELSDRVGADQPAVEGVTQTLEALTEQRVETLIFTHDFQAVGGRCPQCGLLTQSSGGACPADGTALEAVDDLREAAVEQAVLQDAEVLVVDDPPSALRPPDGVGALLRF